jgi:tetratricopeptide (TPR) repeat protein
MVTPRIAILVFAALFVCSHAGAAQDTGDQTERKDATALFNQTKFLEALPLFEDLAMKYPKDPEILLGLGGCLVSHSATLTDTAAASQERTRALKILLKAKELGENSNLLQNLILSLQASPDGGIKYSDIPAADAAMREAEADFARHDFDGAIQKYSQALDLDPHNAPAALFVGDSYFSKKDFASAAKWYGRASEIDPNSETAYRYYADMLTKNGDMEAARSKSIEAVVAEPYNSTPWRALAAWADANHVRLVSVHVKVPGPVGQAASGKITITLPAGAATNESSAWLAYSMSQALWHGEKFQKQFPQDTKYRHSLAEEADSLASAAKVWSELNKGKSAAPDDPNLALLVKIYQADMIEPYVLLNAADEGISQDYDAYRGKNRAKLEQYLGDFVVPHVPPPAAPPKP